MNYNTAPLSYLSDRESSRSNTLRLLFSKNTMSRTEIAAALNISGAAITNTTRGLLDAGILIPQEDSAQIQQNHRAGRRQSLLSVNPVWKYVLTIEIFIKSFHVAITDLLGNTIIQNSYSISQKTAFAVDFCRNIAQKCRLLLASAGLDTDQLLGAGVSVHGAVDPINGIVMNPALTGQPIPFKEYFSNFLQIPVAVENNVCAVLQSELIYRNHIGESNNILMLKWGPGVGSAMAIGGNIYKGYRFQSPEIGHNTFSSGKGALCHCGRRGCLETFVSEDAIISKLRRLLTSGKDESLNRLLQQYGPPSEQTLLKYLAADCLSIRKLLDDCLEKLVNAANNAIIILAPDRLALYGHLFSSEPIYQAFTEMLLSRNRSLPNDFCVHNTTLSEKPHIGCTAIVIQQILFSESIFA